MVTPEVGPFDRGALGPGRTFTPASGAQRSAPPGRPGCDDHQPVMAEMTVRDIQHHLASTLSVGTISITDAVADVLEWQRRPLEEFYPVWSTRRDSGQGPR